MAAIRKVIVCTFLSLFLSLSNAWAEASEAPATVNINSADAATIAQALNGVGEVRAKAIVEWRETYGPFKSLDELLEVKGIGEATVEHNRQAIVLD